MSLEYRVCVVCRPAHLCAFARFRLRVLLLPARRGLITGTQHGTFKGRQKEGETRKIRTREEVKQERKRRWGGGRMGGTRAEETGTEKRPHAPPQQQMDAPAQSSLTPPAKPVQISFHPSFTLLLLLCNALRPSFFLYPSCAKV